MGCRPSHPTQQTFGASADVAVSCVDIYSQLLLLFGIASNCLQAALIVFCSFCLIFITPFCRLAKAFAKRNYSPCCFRFFPVPGCTCHPASHNPKSLLFFVFSFCSPHKFNQLLSSFTIWQLCTQHKIKDSLTAISHKQNKISYLS